MQRIIRDRAWNLRKAGAAASPVALALTAALALTGCGGVSAGANEGSSGGTGLTYGAEKEAYVEALADMDPVTLVMQSTAPKGAPTGRRFENYAAAVEEWSGGKIKFDIVFANGIAPPAEVDNALADGRIDIGSTIPALEPSRFPVSNVLGQVSFLGRQTPVDGLLQWHGAILDVASETGNLDAEYEDKGIKLLVPLYSSGSLFAECSKPTKSLEDFKGKLIASQSTVQIKQAEALGMTPSTISYAEMFEALERGVVNCAMSSMTVASLVGLVPAAPHFAYDPKAGFGNAGGTFSISLDRWKKLPLAAQQLMYDRLDAFFTANLQAAWENISNAMKAVEKEGGSVEHLDASASAALKKTNAEILDSLRSSKSLSDGGAFVDSVLDAEKRWEKTVTELGIKDIDTDYTDFVAWYSPEKIKLDGYFDKLWSDVMNKRRPS